MIILSDIIMNDYTSGDIIISALTHYYSLDKTNFDELAMYLKALTVRPSTTVMIQKPSDNNPLSMILRTSMAKDMQCVVDMDAANFNDCGMRLTGVVSVSSQFFTDDISYQDIHLQTEMTDEIESLIPLYQYDEYLVCHFDKYAMGDMDKKTIL